MPIRPAVLRRIVISGIFLACSVAARADVLYNNFGNSDTYSYGAGLIVTNDSRAYSSVAIGFIPAFSYYLSSIEFVATDLIPNYSGSISVGIFDDNEGQPGSSPIESFTLSGPFGQFGTAAPVMTVSSLLHPVLQAGAQYWVGLNAPVGGFLIWNQNQTGATGFVASDGFGNWLPSPDAQGVLRVEGDLAPQIPLSQVGQDAEIAEPRVWWLLAGGMAALYYIARLAHQEKRPSYERGHRR